jgi:hypothetical protein
MRTRLVAIAAGLLAVGVGSGACNFDITNTNQPTIDDLVTAPTRSKLQAAATGLFAGARSGIQAFIWRLGSMGREGINLSGNNQPDFQEPYFGPLQAGGSFGGTLWVDRYAHIRSVHVFLEALANNPTAGIPASDRLSAQEIAGARGVANTLKALAFLYIVETRGPLGAPVDVDRPVTADPAPFVSEDSVYGYIVGLLDGAATDLANGGGNFFFAVPPGLAAFETPATFLQFNRALAAKANVLRATAANGCRGTPATCYAAALTALGGSFLDPNPAALQSGAYFDFSSASGDTQNGLSEPLNALTFFALQDNIADADTQANGRKDQRVLDKIVPAADTQIALLGAIPIPGELKFVVYAPGGTADPGHPIPIIKDEELLLLRAEARWFTGDKANAIADLDVVRTNSGRLPPSTLTPASPDSDFVKALLYERRYSLLWEQGTRWIDARRFGRLSDIPPDVLNGNVPPYMPVPLTECQSRNLATKPVAQDVVTCTPLTP